MNFTPGQVNKLITREEFEARLTEMESRLVSREEFHHVLDAVIKQLDRIEHASVSNQAAHDRYEKRITRTEKELGLSPYSFSVADDK